MLHRAYVLVKGCWIGSDLVVNQRTHHVAWLAWKVILFAGVLACGIGIRCHIGDAKRAWPRIRAGQGSNADEATVRSAMQRGTYVLWLLWALLLVIGWLGEVKPS